MTKPFHIGRVFLLVKTPTLAQQQVKLLKINILIIKINLWHQLGLMVRKTLSTMDAIFIITYAVICVAIFWLLFKSVNYFENI